MVVLQKSSGHNQESGKNPKVKGVIFQDYFDTFLRDTISVETSAAF